MIRSVRCRRRNWLALSGVDQHPHGPGSHIHVLLPMYDYENIFAEWMGCYGLHIDRRHGRCIGGWLLFDAESWGLVAMVRG